MKILRQKKRPAPLHCPQNLLQEYQNSLNSQHRLALSWITYLIEIHRTTMKNKIMPEL
jgi:hypothetical protein